MVRKKTTQKIQEEYSSPADQVDVELSSDDNDSQDDLFEDAEEGENENENVVDNGNDQVGDEDNEEEKEEEEDDDDDDDDEDDDDDDDDDDGDIDKAIAKADIKARAKKAPQKKRRPYLNEIASVNTSEELQVLIRKAFQESQTTIAVHRRQLAILKAAMLRAHKLGLSSQFNLFFCHMLNKILPLKKKVKAADKVVKFVSSFFSLINPEENFNENDDQYDEIAKFSRDDKEKLHSDFVERVLKYLTKGIDAENTTVRYRVCQLLSYIVGNSGHLDDELHQSLTDELITRIYDKDNSIRSKAVKALSCFQNEDNSSLSLPGKRLRIVMQNDPSAEVRRECLKNIEKNRETGPYIIERARDKDATNRRFVFSKVLPSFRNISDISPANRTRLLEWGLRDRDERVRKAAGEWLTETWMRDTENDLLKFLERLDVMESDIADSAVRTLLDTKPDIVDNLKIDADFFDNLTPSVALLIRVVFQYCQDNKKTDVIEDLFPVAVDFATLFVKYFRLRAENWNKINDNREAIEKNPELAIELEINDPDEYNYIIMQLLKIAVDYDYSDEYGRSKMYSVLRSILSNNTVTEPILPLLMECLRKLAINERDFCQMIVEIINDLKDTEYERIMELKREEEERIRKEEEERARRKRERRKKANYRSGNNSDSDSIDKDESGYKSLEVTRLNEKVQRLLREEDDDEADSDNSDDEEYHSAMVDISRQSIIDANKSRQEEIDQISVLSPDVISTCLTITKCMLQLVFSPLSENMLLINLLDNFINPCLNKREEVAVRELALTCYGLCGLLNADVAVKTMTLAGIFVAKSEYESFVIVGLKVIGDLLIVHGISILQSDDPTSIDSMAVAKIFYRTLKDESKPEAQAVVAVLLFKLFLSDVIDDDELFETTLLTYFNPKVNKNIPLKQCLTFCIQTYARSLPKHQELVASVVYDTIERLYKDWSSIMELNQKLELKKPITPTFIVESFLGWTDPYTLARVSEEDRLTMSVHLDVGIQFMKLLRNYDYRNKVHKTLYKPIIKSLAKLVYTAGADIEKLRAFRACFDDQTLCHGDLDEALNSDVICKRDFLKAHTYIQKCLDEAEKMEEERVKEEGGDEHHLDHDNREKRDVKEVNDNDNVTDNEVMDNEKSKNEELDEESDTSDLDTKLNPQAQSSMIKHSDESEDDDGSIEGWDSPPSDPPNVELKSDPESENENETNTVEKERVVHHQATEMDSEAESDSSIEITEEFVIDKAVRADAVKVKQEVVVKKEKVKSVHPGDGRVTKPQRQHRQHRRQRQHKKPHKRRAAHSGPDSSEIILLDSD